MSKKKKGYRTIAEMPSLRNIEACIVLRPDGTHVATIHAYNSPSGPVKVDCYGHDKKATTFQRGDACGWGFDKKAAAMADMLVDGHMLYGSHEKDEETKDIVYDFVRGDLSVKEAEKKAEAIGAQFKANRDRTGSCKPTCYYYAGLRRLVKMGYQIIQVF